MISRSGWGISSSGAISARRSVRTTSRVFRTATRHSHLAPRTSLLPSPGSHRSMRTPSGPGSRGAPSGARSTGGSSGTSWLRSGTRARPMPRASSSRLESGKKSLAIPSSPRRPSDPFGGSPGRASGRTADPLRRGGGRDLAPQAGSRHRGALRVGPGGLGASGAGRLHQEYDERAVRPRRADGSRSCELELGAAAAVNLFPFLPSPPPAPPPDAFLLLLSVRGLGAGSEPVHSSPARNFSYPSTRIPCSA